MQLVNNPKFTTFPYNNQIVVVILDASIPQSHVAEELHDHCYILDAYCRHCQLSKKRFYQVNDDGSMFPIDNPDSELIYRGNQVIINHNFGLEFNQYSMLHVPSAQNQLKHYNAKSNLFDITIKDQLKDLKGNLNSILDVFTHSSNELTEGAKFIKENSTTVASGPDEDVTIDDQSDDPTITISATTPEDLANLIMFISWQFIAKQVTREIPIDNIIAPLIKQPHVLFYSSDQGCYYYQEELPTYLKIIKKEVLNHD